MGYVEVIPIAFHIKSAVGFNVITEFTRLADEFSRVKGFGPCSRLLIGRLHVPLWTHLSYEQCSLEIGTLTAGTSFKIIVDQLFSKFNLVFTIITRWVKPVD